MIDDIYNTQFIKFPPWHLIPRSDYALMLEVSSDKLARQAQRKIGIAPEPRENIIRGGNVRYYRAGVIRAFHEKSTYRQDVIKWLEKYDLPENPLGFWPEQPDEVLSKALSVYSFQTGPAEDRCMYMELIQEFSLTPYYISVPQRFIINIPVTFASMDWTNAEYYARNPLGKQISPLKNFRSTFSEMETGR